MPKPKTAKYNVACSLCGDTITKDATFVWWNFTSEKAAGRSGMVHPQCYSSKEGTKPAKPAKPAPTTPLFDKALEDRITNLETAIETLDSTIKDKLDASDTLADLATDLEELRAKVAEASAHNSLTIEIKNPKAATPLTIETAHNKLPELLTTLTTLHQAYVFGPAGAGKTTMARQAAEALGVDFYYVQLGGVPPWVLTGFPTANGTVLETDFRRAYVNGGLVLLDELDNTQAATAVTLNGALENGRIAFPDGQRDRHADCYVVGAGNTAMTGADETYSARTAQDGAFRERFAFIEILHDAALEEKLTYSQGADPTLAHAWLDRVREIRADLATAAPHILVTPRASIRGAQILADHPETKFSWLVEALILKGAAPQGSDIRGRLEGNGLL